MDVSMYIVNSNQRSNMFLSLCSSLLKQLLFSPGLVTAFVTSTSIKVTR